MIKNNFEINCNNEEKINKFLILNNNQNNTFIKLLFYIKNEIKEINENIKISLKCVFDYCEEILEITLKIKNFEDTYKIDKLEEQLYDKFSFKFLDKIIFHREF